MIDFIKQKMVILAVLVLAVWMLGGCSEDNPVDGGTIEGNLFPLAAGRVWVSTAYELDTTGVRIESSAHREVLYAHAAVNYAGRQAYLMIDSVYSSFGPLNFADTTYMATDGENFFLFVGEWIEVFKSSEGLNKEYEAGTFTTNEFGVPLQVVVRGKILPPESVVVPMGTVEAYKLEIKYTISLGFITFEEGLNVWFADGIGPVKFQTPPPYDPIAGQRLKGSESVLVSKNF